MTFTNCNEVHLQAAGEIGVEKGFGVVSCHQGGRPSWIVQSG